MISRQVFGKTGFQSSRVIFGAAALAAMKPARVEATLALVERMGVDRVDLTQLHNRVDEDDLQVAMGHGGTVEALAQARHEALFVRGVTDAI